MKKDFWKRLDGKGYYIALILCAVAIGISGFVYYRTAGLEAPPADVPVDATGPLEGASLSDKPTTPTQTERKPLKLRLPVEGQIVRPHCVDCLSYDPTTRDWRTHEGLDLAAETGTPVTAAADGTVYTTYQDETMGTTVVLSHEGGYVTTYASLSPELKVQTGQEVHTGDVIGTVGNTALLETALGDHIHFTVLLDDEPVDPASLMEQS